MAGNALGCCNQGSITGRSLSPVDVGGIAGEAHGEIPSQPEFNNRF